MALERKQLFHTRLAVVYPKLPINASTVAMATRVARVAELSGYHVTLNFMRGKENDNSDILNAASLADQVVSFTPLDDATIAQIEAMGVKVLPPVVEAGTVFFHVYGAISSYIGRIMTERLISRGRTNLAYACIDDPSLDVMTQLRFAGMIESCLPQGVKSPVMFRTEYSNTNLAGDIVAFLRKHPNIDGMLCHNDLVAIEMMQALRMTGRTVPSDMAVIGVDNGAESALVNPTLTTVGYQLAETADFMGKAFVATIEGKDADIPTQAELAELCFVVGRESA